MDNTINVEPNRFYWLPKTKGIFSLGPTFNLTFHQDYYPNAWHRFWQRVILGIYWRKA